MATLTDPFAPSVVFQGKGFIEPRTPFAPGPGGSFTLSRKEINGDAEPVAADDKTMVYVGVGLVLAAGAAWYLLR